VSGVEYGNEFDLQLRLSTISEGTSRKLSVVLGSGPSNSVLPNVSELTRLFRAEIPTQGLKRFDDTIQPLLGTGLGYQNAASILKFQAGDVAVARAVRKAVLRACMSLPEADRAAMARDVDGCTQLEHDGKWSIPEAYRAFALYFKRLPASVRGPIITTNFDPLIELAFRDAGLLVESVPIPYDSVPTPEQLQHKVAIPVFHIHGYWTSNATLSTIGQLTRSRPSLRSFLSRTLQQSTVLVLGYGGWKDAFISQLHQRLEERDLFETELCWAVYGEDAERALNEAAVDAFYGLPGFNLYLGVDAHSLFGPIEVDEPSTASKAGFQPPGHTWLRGIGRSNESGMSGFVDGSQPSWDDAAPGVWPELTATREMIAATATILRAEGGSAVVVVGPLGEGKSLGIRQAALRIADMFPDWAVLWREPGAPSISEEWLQDLHTHCSSVLVVSDDADLIKRDLSRLRTTWGAGQSGIAFLLASHDRLWWRLAGTVPSEVIAFEGLTRDDARAIARRWLDYNLAPPSSGPAEGRLDDLVERLITSSASIEEGQRTTLFGAVLDVRYGAGLRDRVANLLAALAATPASPNGPITLADVFGGICLLQTLANVSTSGMSRKLIAALVDPTAEYRDGRVLTLLGREAAITFAGDRILSRHPSIARHAVELLREGGKLPALAELLALVGGRMRKIGGVHQDEYRDAYLLAQRLTVREEAVAAAKGAIRGAPKLLEPRVTSLRVTRSFDPVEARRLAEVYSPHLLEYDDYGTAVRVFLSEYSVIARACAEPALAIGLAALALHDGVGYTVDEEQASYALGSVSKSAAMLNRQGERLAPGLPALCCRALRPLAGDAKAARYSGCSTMPHDYESLSLDSVVLGIGLGLSTYAVAAFKATRLPLNFEGPLRLHDLGDLLTRQSRTWTLRPTPRGGKARTG
jgi:hypothetical protein